MPIKRSSRQEIDGLITDLAADRSIVREAAVARLTVIGVRAIDRLTGVLASSQPAATRAAALRALEGIGGTRALQAVLAAVDDRDDAVAAAAITSARSALRGARGAAIVDRLARVALDTRRHRDVRLSSIQALSDLDAGTLEPLWKALARDPNRAVREEAQATANRPPTARSGRPPVATGRLKSGRQ